jgi:Ca2+-binding EF-hand superfamily protein
MKSSQDMELGEKSSEEWVEFENPTSAGEQMSTAQMVAANEAEMSEAELADLSYAFQAADMDGGGAIDIGGTRVSIPRVLECGN